MARPLIGQHSTENTEFYPPTPEPTRVSNTMEAHLFPWLDSDCMADDRQDDHYFEDEDDED